MRFLVQNNIKIFGIFQSLNRTVVTFPRERDMSALRLGLSTTRSCTPCTAIVEDVTHGTCVDMPNMQHRVFARTALKKVQKYSVLSKAQREKNEGCQHLSRHLLYYQIVHCPNDLHFLKAFILFQEVFVDICTQS